MSPSEFFIWSGRWRKVCVESGWVSGMGRVRFVYLRGGRLRLARSGAVLAGLRALAAGRPTTVRDGAPLPYRRRKGTKRKAADQRCHQHCCQHSMHTHECPGKSVPVIPEPAPPAAQRVDAAVQAAVTAHPTSSLLIQQLNNQHINTTTPKQSTHNKKKHKRLESDKCKELVINEQDLDLYRSYLIKNDPNFDLYQFDAYENYKLRILFRMNPLVAVERSPQIKRMLQTTQSSQETISLKDFATKLGLRSISDQEEERNSTREWYKMRNRLIENKTIDISSSEENNEENKSPNKPVRQSMWRKLSRSDRNRIRHKREVSADKDMRKKLMVEAVQRNIAQQKSGSSASDGDIAKKKFFKKKTALGKKNYVKSFSQPPKGVKKSANGREYSNLEDHAIVSWVSVGNRARRVSGNRLWKELHHQYRAITGVGRSWHSLRNRYLRYILPTLAALALPPAHAQRLRAAAARGELKTKNKPPAPHPLLAAPRVRSAWALRPRTSHRSSPPCPRSSPSPSRTPSRSPSPQRASSQRVLRNRSLLTENSDVTVTSRQEEKRVLRSSAVGVSPPGPAPSPPPREPRPPHSPRRRKLYNPNAAMF